MPDDYIDRSAWVEAGAKPAKPAEPGGKPARGCSTYTRYPRPRLYLAYKVNTQAFTTDSCRNQRLVGYTFFISTSNEQREDKQLYSLNIYSGIQM